MLPVQKTATASVTRWEWQNLWCRSVPQNNGARQLEVADKSFEGIDFVHAVIDPAQSKFDVVETSVPAKGCRSRGALFFNGGYFDYTRRPVGLLISEGKLLARQSQDPKLSGIFLLRDGRAQIVQATMLTETSGIVFAVQCGPLIVEPGGKDGIRSGMEVAERTILAIDNNGRVHLIVTRTKITLLEAQTLVKSQIPDLDAALNLDGGPSSYVRSLGKKSRISSGEVSYPAYLIRVAPR